MAISPRGMQMQQEMHRMMLPSWMKQIGMSTVASAPKTSTEPDEPAQAFEVPQHVFGDLWSLFQHCGPKSASQACLCSSLFCLS